MANAKAIFQDGGTRTTRIGYINKNWVHVRIVR